MSVVSELVKIKVQVEGLPPGLLFQSKNLMDVARPGAKPLPPDEEARLRAHWVKVKGKDQLAIPWVMFYRSICKAGASFKAKGKRTYESILGPTLACEQVMIPLGTDEFETFVEWVKIPPRTGATVKIGRPLIREWECEFIMIADCETYEPKAIEDIIVTAGKTVGIGAWRPQLKGPYGKYRLVGFDILRN